MHPVESYLSEMGTIRATRAGTGETSYYPALATLLNEIGKTLAPKVSCVIQLQNRGAGLPDGGLFTADQCRHRSRAGDGDLFSAQTPSRGLTPDEVRHVTDTCRRLAALIGMQGELDRNYAASREG